jgi:peptidase M49-like protein
MHHATRGLLRLVAAGLGLALAACRNQPDARASLAGQYPTPIEKKLAQYTTVRLSAPLDRLTAKERQMVPLLIEAARSMDAIFWQQAYGNKDSLLRQLHDSATRRYAEINYGPWDRLDNNAPFVNGVGPKPPGAAFYPRDMTKEEFETAAKASPSRAKTLKNLYTVVRRNPAGALEAVPYHQVFGDQLKAATGKLREAATLAEDPGLKRYLELRARALETDEYQPSDFAWLAMKTNTIELVIGPIETYEDQLFGYKASHEAFVLLKDRDWSARLARYTAMLPGLQKELPVPAAYKREKPGSDSDLNAYDVLYYAGDANAGSKTIAINLPNDEEVQLKKGTRRLQLKNAMQAKFEKILLPIADELIAQDQRSRITFDAFFANVMFHEVAHGLGIKNTINGKGTVREALREQAGALEEGKADILGLYMITKLHERGELKGQDLDDNYVTFLASIFRSIRFGASNAHGRANATQLSFFQDRGAFDRDSTTGKYRVDFPKMRAAVDQLAGQILRFQGNGDYAGVSRFMNERGRISPTVQQDLARLQSKGIPVDVVFEQGTEVLR